MSNLDFTQRRDGVALATFRRLDAAARTLAAEPSNPAAVLRALQEVYELAVRDAIAHGTEFFQERSR